MAQMTTDLCEAKHGELMRALVHIEAKLDDVLCLVNGNGKPGLRQTQAELQRVVDQIAEDKARRDSWLMTLVRPALPLIYAAVLSGLYIGLR